MPFGSLTMRELVEGRAAPLASPRGQASNKWYHCGTRACSRCATVSAAGVCVGAHGRLDNSQKVVSRMIALRLTVQTSFETDVHCNSHPVAASTMRAVSLIALLAARSTLASSCTRRVILSRSAAAAVTTLSLPALAAQRGAEPAYQNQAFSDEVCTRRTPLGACAESKPEREEAPPPLNVLQPVAEPQSDLVRSLLKKTADNADANAQLVREKTIKAGQPGQFGPFAKEAPVMREDGSFDSIPLRRYDKLKDKGKLEKTATGLDRYVKGFDPDAPEPKEKFLGIF